MALICDLFTNLIDADRRPEVDAAVRARRSSTRSRSCCRTTSTATARCRSGSKTSPAETEHRHFSHLFGLFPGRQITASRRRRCSPPRARRSNCAATAGPAGAWRGRSTLGAAARRRSCRSPARRTCCAWSRSHGQRRRRRRLPQPVRRPSAVPDRRQLRRRLGHRRDAGAEPRGRDRSAAGAAIGVACRKGDGLRARGGFELEVAWLAEPSETSGSFD